jgi:hypothetical protein
MPKNAQYGRWRRAAMQAVMWVIFGGTLALASYVSHRRTASLDVALDEPTVVGDLRVRLPKGWDREKPDKSQTQALQPQALVLRERDEEGRPRRELWITQERQTERQRGPAFYLETQLNVSDARPESFEFLGTRGVLFSWRGIPHGEDMEQDPEQIDRYPDPGLYACAVLRDGLTVTVQVRGGGAYGPTNRRLIRQVADTMKRANAPATTSAIRPSDRNVE